MFCYDMLDDYYPPSTITNVNTFNYWHPRLLVSLCSAGDAYVCERVCECVCVCVCACVCVCVCVCAHVCLQTLYDRV